MIIAKHRGRSKEVWAATCRVIRRCRNTGGDRNEAEKRRSNQGLQSKVNIIYIMRHSPKGPTSRKRRLGRVGTRSHGGLPHSLRKIGNQAVPPRVIGRRPVDRRQASAAGRIPFRALQPPALRAATMRLRIVDRLLARTSSDFNKLRFIIEVTRQAQPFLPLFPVRFPLMMTKRNT